MTALEIARRFVELGEVEQAQDAWSVALDQDTLTPAERLEGAVYIFFSQGDHRIALTQFIGLYNAGNFREEIWTILYEGFYLPNLEEQKKRYKINCERLKKYPYLFQKGFLEFEEHPILFFPFDEKGYIPYYPDRQCFGPYIDPNDPVIDRYFFKDLSKPILAENVYSQYQLEYLNDNVRKSEWVAKENHIYLHYTDFSCFCAWLKILDLRQLLKQEKLVFLFGEELSCYPIDFKEKFGIDYSTYSVKPVGIREIQRLIWHSQLSSHNGGDFFNEVLYEHPNLIAAQSVILTTIEDVIAEVKKDLRGAKKSNLMLRKLRQLKDPTDRDIFVALFLYFWDSVHVPDPASRITPAILFQPHFYNIKYLLYTYPDLRDATVLSSKEADRIHHSPIFQGFRYIKTFVPMRRPTTSYAATVRFVVEKPHLTEEEKNEPKQRKAVSDNQLLLRLTNRSFMFDRWDRLYRDSRLIRFEDGKLNPRATFTALAEFLDIPYTESMTYCSNANGVNEVTLRGSMRGFDASAVYRTYDEFADDAERSFLEYFMRDVYETYGYDFHYYKGEPVDERWVDDKVKEFHKLFYFVDRQMREAIRYIAQEEAQELDDLKTLDLDQVEQENERNIQKAIQEMRVRDLELGKLLLRGLRFVNKDGQPLQMMKPLELDPALLEQPLYH